MTFVLLGSQFVVLRKSARNADRRIRRPLVILSEFSKKRRVEGARRVSQGMRRGRSTIKKRHPIRHPG